MKDHMSLSTKQTHKLNLLNQRLVRRTISGSDSHTSRQLHIEADAIKQSTDNEISQLLAPRVSRRSKTGVLSGLLLKANPKQGSEYYQEENRTGKQCHSLTLAILKHA
ncbi:hypothetical protein M1Q06_16035 [Planococcus sp. 11815]|uniref:hypothetical protein n=1 Tax=Planococcus sp. 11815 TaxID=2939413 RepID=UPI003DA3ED83